MEVADGMNAWMVADGMNAWMVGDGMNAWKWIGNVKMVM